MDLIDWMILPENVSCGFVTWQEGDDDDEDEGAVDHHGMLRLVQEDLERARQWRLEKEQKQNQQFQQQQHPASVQPQYAHPLHSQQQYQAQPAKYQPQHTAPIHQPAQHVIAPPPPPPPTTTAQTTPVINGMNNNTTSVPDRERMRKIETFQRKQRELEATQAAEERIIREAQRRKEEDSQRQQWRPAAPGQRLDTLVAGSAAQNITIQNQLAFPSQLVSGAPHGEAPTGATTTTKRVSFFQDVTTYDDNANHEESQHQDPDVRTH